ncbi:MAG: hypothetical protein J2P24_06675 [Streptosporangiales bacterium]|nr:hypothetical protein [Streptosporangiales bacterium]MBO0891260.1 hypothetical protein [Acidothermales bacterium]
MESGRDPVPAIGSAIRGTVVATGPGGCVLVRTDDGDLSLVGRQTTTLRVGQEVLLRGRSDPTASHDCPSGTPFRVAWLTVLR